MSATPATFVATDQDRAAYARDGVVILRGLLTRRRDRAAGPRRRTQPERPEPARDERDRPGRPGAFVEDFRNWQRIDGVRAGHPRLGAARRGRAADRRLRRAAVPRPPAGQGGRDARPQSVAPGPAVLLHRRHADRLVLDPAGPGRAARARSSSSPARTPVAAGTCRGRSSRGPRWCSRRARSRRCPTSTPTATAFDVRGWAMEPGDVVAFNMLTLHAAAGRPRAAPRVLRPPDRRRRHLGAAAAPHEPAVRRRRPRGRRPARSTRRSRCSGPPTERITRFVR